MAENNASSENESYRIEWFGVDGALCLTYVIEAVFIGYCMINDVDIVIGKIVPYGVAIVSTLIFLKYISQVFRFSKSAGKK
jgi:hypothetical protein